MVLDNCAFCTIWFQCECRTVVSYGSVHFGNIVQFLCKTWNHKVAFGLWLLLIFFISSSIRSFFCVKVNKWLYMIVFWCGCVAVDEYVNVFVFVLRHSLCLLNTILDYKQPMVDTRRESAFLSQSGVFSVHMVYLTRNRSAKLLCYIEDAMKLNGLFDR